MGRLNESIYLFYASLTGLTTVQLTDTQALQPGLNYTGLLGLKTKDEISINVIFFFIICAICLIT